MSIELYAHPFSSYCQKALTALYENDTPFVLRTIDGPDAWAKLETLWPLKRMPLLMDAGQTIVEATMIIEHLALKRPGRVQLIPADPATALKVRTMDRIFDNYVHTPMQKIVGDRIRKPETRDPHGVGEARALLDKSYRWLDAAMAGREWAVGDGFTMADCAAAPALFYADWSHPIGEDCRNLRAYRQRLLARPSFARAVDDARPYRHYFPLGAPDRD
jgi:glutathione S-transferase